MARHYRRHPRAAREEVKLSPKSCKIMMYKNRHKIIGFSVIFILFCIVKWFWIGYLAGYSKATSNK